MSRYTTAKNKSHTKANRHLLNALCSWVFIA